MASNQQPSRAPLRISSAQSAPGRVAHFSSPAMPPTPTERPNFSTPTARQGARAQPSSSSSYGTQSRGSSRAGSSRAGPSRAGSSRAGSSRAGPSRAGPSRAGSSRAGSSRASSRMVTSSYQSSPQLPMHPQRQRLSLRPSSQRASSAISSPHPEDNHGEADELLSQEDADALNEIIMAIDMKENGARGCTLGCAYYIALDEALYLLEDVAMAGVDLVETLLLYAKPTTVLISSRASESLADCLARAAQGIDGNRGDLPGAYILRNLNSADFRYDTGKDKLLGLDLEMAGRQSMLYTTVVDEGIVEDDHGGQEGSRQGRLMRLGTSVNLDSQLTVGCAGAVLNDLHRRKTAQYLPNDPDALVAYKIRSVEMFSLFDFMFVNADTFASLQILQSEHHPNSHQQGGAKENLSVYGLFHHLASTPQGKLKLRQIFLRPSMDIDLINERQQTFSFFLRPGNAESLMNLGKYLRKVKNMKPVMALLRKGVDSPGRKISVNNHAWATLQRFAAYSLQLREMLRELQGAEKIVIIRKVCEIIDPFPIGQVGELITQTVDFEQSIERARTAVKYGVDAELDGLKQSYDGMEDFLTRVVTRLRDEVPEWARKYVKNCIFLPQLGFLTVVSLNTETGKGNYDGEGLNDVWERMFAAEGCVYYKNGKMKDMDAEFGDAYCMIIDREVEMIHGLTVRILEQEDAIIAASEVLGELDSFVAISIGCGQYKWTAPKMTHENVIHIEGGRHPLQELVVPSFIANDCAMAGGLGDYDRETPGVSSSAASDGLHDSVDCPSTLLLTGPNHSGKSVYLKHVAIIVYLAHIGCFVPAERARIGITDRILTRIATRESVSRNESAFAIDLRQVAFAMNFATCRSLVLIDEFGKGTNSQDGAGLLTATLHHFASLGSERPKVLAATHFHEIFEGQFVEESAELAFAHMDIRLDYDAGTPEDQVIYLFQLVPGRSISSFGSRCAAMNGIDQAVVDRAETIMLHMVRNEDLEVVCSQLSEAESQKLAAAEAVARAFLEEDFGPPPGITGKKATDEWYQTKLQAVLSAGDRMPDATSSTT